jgi:hypothetical protein
VKFTTLMLSMILLVCVAYGQEPVNHAVLQPTVSQPMATQPSVSQPGNASISEVYQPFVFQPMANIPHHAHQAAVVLIDASQPGQPVRTTVRQTSAADAPSCTCTSRP